ncbi:hypothetical protein FRB99_001130, partial [Tulasnella sp. 403]
MVVWAVTYGTLIASVDLISSMWSLKFALDKKWLVSAGAGAIQVLGDGARGPDAPYREIWHPQCEIQHISVSRDGKRVVWSSHRGEVVVTDTSRNSYILMGWIPPSSSSACYPTLDEIWLNILSGGEFSDDVALSPILEHDGRNFVAIKHEDKILTWRYNLNDLTFLQWPDGNADR